MKISPRMDPIMLRAALAGAAFAGVFLVTAANAQMPMNAATPTSAGTPVTSAALTNAQLQEEIIGLRKEVAELQREQKESTGVAGGMTTDKQGNSKCKEGMKMGTATDGQKGCMAMGEGKSMKKDGMGMPASSDKKAKTPDAPMKDDPME